MAKRKRRPRIAEDPASWLAGYDDGIVARLQDPRRPLRGSDVEGHSLSYLLGYGEGSAQRTDEMVLREAGKQQPNATDTRHLALAGDEKHRASKTAQGGSAARP